MESILNWCVFLILLTKVNANIKDLTILVQKNRNSFDATCMVTGNSTNLAVDWITSISSKDSRTETQYVSTPQSNYNCDISKTKRACNDYWYNFSNWKLQSSLSSTLGPVLDRRWETFRNVYTDGGNTYKKVFDLEKQFRIHISIRGSEGHLYLCDGYTPNLSNCYWIIINGWSGRTTGIRKCKYGEIPTKGYPSGTCYNLRQNTTLLQPILDPSKWVHFTLHRTENRIVLYMLGDDNPLFSYKEEGSSFQGHFAMVKSPSAVFWKFHEYEYTFTTSKASSFLGPQIRLDASNFCICMFVTMCVGCKMIFDVVYLQQNKEVAKMTIEVNLLNENYWQEVKTNILYENAEYILMRVTTVCEDCEQPFWAIDDFRICAEREIRLIKSSLKLEELVCQIVGTSEQITYNGIVSTKPPEISCPDGSFGNTCEQCSAVLPSTCNQYAICNVESTGEHICRCASGYTGTHCQEECSHYFFGHGCREECGYCVFAQCNAVSGDCFQGQCLYDFKGKQCKIPPLPMLNVAPKVIAVKYTSCVVQLQDASYIGEPTPLSYKLQYKLQNDDKWISVSTFDMSDREPVEIYNLTTLTSYHIRAVLIVSNGSSYEMESIPKGTFTTSCAFAEIDDVFVEVTNISATITIKNNSESCRSSDYRMWFNDTLLEVSDSYKFKIEKLTPYTYYQLSIRSIVRNGTLLMDVNTLEGAASKVLNITTFADSTSITVSWNKPAVPNGVIQYYEVSYHHVYNLACTRPTSSNSGFEQRVLVYDTTVRLPDLIPYSEYNLTIVPITVIEGELLFTISKTTATDKPNDDEMPIIKNVAASDKFVSILLDAPNCAIIKGPIVLVIVYQCYNDWCPGSRSLNFTLDDYKGRPVRIEPLLPYTDYDINIKISRSLENIQDPHVLTKVTTLSAAPNQIKNIVVYSKNETSVSVRYPSPFPKTGVLEGYRIESCTSAWNRKCFTVNIPAKECLLWPHLQCVTIHNLNERVDYIFTIAAKNNNTAYGRDTIFYARTIVEGSSELLNLTASFDEYYNLTLSWIHPSISNGVITSFHFVVLNLVTICNDHTVPMSEDKYQNKYTSTVPLNSSCYSSVLDIYGWASTNFTIRGNVSETHNIISPPVTPTFIEEPKIVTLTNTSVSVNLQGLTNFQNESLMYILLTTSSDVDIQNEYDAKIWKQSGLTETSSSWIAAEYRYNFLNQTSKIVILGSGLKFQSYHLHREIHNRPLSPATDYIITILFTNFFMHLERYAVYRINFTTTGLTVSPLTKSDNALFALLLLLLVPLVIWFIVWKVKKNKDISWNTLITMVNTESSAAPDPDVIPLTTNARKKSNPAIPPKRKTMSNSSPRQSTSDKYSKPIKIMEFENYVKESILNGELERQHQLFPRGQTKPWDYGILPQNKSKNRYNNLIAYDHTRVKLEKIGNDEFSDYINANYIQGYNTPNAYIGTQGPRPATVNDFWRMIWQENVQYIVMLANVIEGGKKKSEQYWPNINERIAYGNIQVLYTSNEVFADYEYRTFSVQYQDETRKVEHLHFTSWPDHGVPLYCQSLVPFLRKLLTVSQGTSPVVVHCSAGVGRTGTIILADICLRMAAREGIVDVLKHQHLIREQRVNLVDNLEQYKLVHLVLLECLIAPQTSFTCDETIEKSITKVLETDTLQYQIEYLDNTNWQDNAMQPSIALEIKPQWALKNRFQDIVPSGVGRIYLTRYPVSDEHSDYINAIEVDGFRAQQRFIATQQPLPHTVCDFWRMIDEKETCTIVLLNKIDKEDKTSCIFWPTEKLPEIKPVPYITLTYQNLIKRDTYSVVTITLQNTKTKKVNKRTVSLIYLKNWLPIQVVPENNDTLVTIWEEMEKLTRGNENPIVVTCHDGITACGLFLALTFVIEKIKLEQQCDVCLAVRTVRHNQKKFVTKKEQFVFLYKSTLVYLSAFELYSNFNSIIKN